MKIAVIICEYNPLQKGHVYHIRKTIEDCGCDGVVCIMSGNFVQRGEAAIADKYTRAEWAVRNGADLVVELPLQYVLTTARYFASGAVKLADKIKCAKGEKILSFGSEEGDIEKLKQAVAFKESEQFKTLFESFISLGKGYAASYSLALEQSDREIARILSSPNNTLAVEYLRAIDETGSDLIPYTLKRIGGYDDIALKGDFVSASAIRHAVKTDDVESVKDYVPREVFSYLSSLAPDALDKAHDKLFSIIKYNLNVQNASQVHGAKEGIENRIAKHIAAAKDFQSLVSAVATKRYTDAYIRRTLLNIALDNRNTSEDLENRAIDSVNVLAVKENRRDMLSLFDCQLNFKGSTDAPFSLTQRSDGLYSSIFGNFPKTMRVVKV